MARMKQIKRIYIERTSFGDALRMGICSKDDEDPGVRHFFNGETWERQGLEFSFHSYGMCINEEQAQQMADTLFDCGIRPTQGKGSIGQLSAIEKHLEDMRKIVFDGLKIK